MNHDLAMKYVALAQQAIDYAKAIGVWNGDYGTWKSIYGGGLFKPDSIDVWGDETGGYAVTFGEISVDLYSQRISYPYGMNDAELLTRCIEMSRNLMGMIYVESIDGCPV